MYKDYYQVSPESTRTVNRDALATMPDNCALDTMIIIVAGVTCK
jgi:hypothetical protein